MTRRRPRLRILKPPPVAAGEGRDPDLLPFPGPMHSAFVTAAVLRGLADVGLGIAVIVEAGNLCLVAARPEDP